MKTNDQKASEMIKYAGFMQDMAIEAFDLKMFAKYHKIALYLIEYRIGLVRKGLGV